MLELNYNLEQLLVDDCDCDCDEDLFGVKGVGATVPSFNNPIRISLISRILKLF